MASCLFSLQKPTDIILDCLHCVYSYPLSHGCPPESYAPSGITTILLSLSSASETGEMPCSADNGTSVKKTLLVANT